jgi:hypothetical protein
MENNNLVIAQRTKSILALLNKLVELKKKKFYGTVIIKFENGEPKIIDVTEKFLISNMIRGK